MQRRIAGWLAGILAVGILARLLLLDASAVNSDDGMWLYDATQITWGRTPIVDYPSRSPLLHFLLAWIPLLDPDIGLLRTARLFQITVGAVVTLLTFALARELATDRVGLVAAALYWFAPLSLGYGLYIKTEVTASAFVLAAVWVFVRQSRLDWPNAVLAPAAIGALLGTGLFVRRSVFIPLGVLVLVLAVYHRYRPAVTLTTAFAGTAAIGYLALGGSLSTAWAVADQHFIGLVADRGFGGIEYVGFEGFAEHTTGRSRFWMTVYNIGVLEGIIYACGVHLACMGVWGRRLTDQYRVPDITTWALGTVALAGIFAGAYQSRLVPVLGAVILGTLTVGLARFDADIGRLYTRGTGTVWAIIGAYTVGYLARNRIMYPEYALDPLPFMAVVGAIAAVALYRAQPKRAKQWVAIGGIALIGLTLLTTPVLAGLTGSYYTTNDIEEIGADIDDRDIDVVLTAQPLYVIESDATVAGDFSRSFYIVREAPNSPHADETIADFREQTCASDLVILDANLYRLIDHDAGLAFDIMECHEKTDAPAATMEATEYYTPKGE